jgi:predicted nuclease with TOPRIM domain
MLRQKHRFFEITPEVEVADKRLEARMEELVLECMALEEEVRKEEDEVSEVRVRRAALEGEREALKHIAKVKREAVDDSRKEFEKIRENLKPGVSTAELLTTQRNLMNLVSSKTEAEVR